MSEKFTPWPSAASVKYLAVRTKTPPRRSSTSVTAALAASHSAPDASPTQAFKTARPSGDGWSSTMLNSASRAPRLSSSAASRETPGR